MMALAMNATAAITQSRCCMFLMTSIRFSLSIDAA